MSLTIEKPETEARLIRYAAARGLSTLEALEALLDAAEDDEDFLTIDTMPESLRHASKDDFQAAQAEMDRGEWVSGASVLDALRKPLSR